MELTHFDAKSFDEALNSGRLVMADFGAVWCGHCQTLGPVVEQLAEEYGDQGVTIGKVDIDQCPELAQRYGIMGVPTVLFLKNGQELDRKVGAMPYGVYADVLDSQLDAGV